MRFRKQDLKKILAEVKLFYEEDFCDVMIPASTLEVGDLRFLRNDYDRALFYQTHPDADDYHQENIQTVYEVLTLIDQGRIPESVYCKQGRDNTEWIDIGMLINQRTSQLLRRWRKQSRKHLQDVKNPGRHL